MRASKVLSLALLLFAVQIAAIAQDTKILGFVDVTTALPITSTKTGPLSFSLGEQDLFITSDISDRVSFLGETVFKFSNSSPTKFDISVERIVIKYNIYGNHNILIGKHHTPVNYWNETYHHGRVFFPTIARPTLFSDNIIPLHTTGISVQGANLGNLKFGYELMVGNGLGSTDILDDNPAKSITAAVHIKPIDGMRIGLSYYHDNISKNSMLHQLDKMAMENYEQQMANLSFSYFGKKFEALAEGSLVLNSGDSTNMTMQTIAGYAYAGYKVAKKVVVYVRYDNVQYDNAEMFYKPATGTLYSKQVIVGGARYEFNYLANVKLEFQNMQTSAATTNMISAQFAIGF
ncbi:MAG: hypothetical protein JST82_10070 [Bacteroidetes bacterium]|nr:hypothetical protein [Bacteroidota bacterium]